jgi:4-amino-4-deoxy-L-arabinose transferase-like glycosyltransferase
MVRKPAIWLVIFILLLAVFLRLFLINSGCIWLDEGYRFIQSQNLRAYFNYLIYDTNPPLMPFFLHFWIKFFGKTELVLRLFPLTFSFLSLIVIIIMGLEFFNRKFTLFFLSVISTSPFFIKYSRDITPYAMVLFFGVLSTYLFLHLFNSENNLKRSFFLCYLLTLAGGLYTHYSFLYLFIAQLITIILYRRDINPFDFRNVIRIFVWAIIISNLVVYQLVAQYLFIQGYRWIPALNFRIFWDTLLTITSTKLSLVVSMVCIFIAFRGRAKRYRKFLIDYLIIAGVFPVLVVAVLSRIYHSFFLDRYFLLSAFAIWFLISLIGSGRKLYPLLLGVIVIGNFSKLPDYYEFFQRNYDKKRLYFLISNVVKRNDAVIFEDYRDFTSSVVYNWDKWLPQYILEGRASNIIRYYLKKPYFINQEKLKERDRIFYFVDISLKQALEINKIQGIKVEFLSLIYPYRLYIYTTKKEFSKSLVEKE